MPGIGTQERHQAVEGALPAGVWDLDPAHTTAEFVARHMMVAKVRGRFADVTGYIRVGDEPGDIEAEATIAAASISTLNEQRDAHLRSPDFLDVERYPKIHFRTTSLTHGGGSSWKAQGELSIKDVTRPIELDVEVNGFARSPWGKDVAFISITGEIDREDYGMTWNQQLEAGGVLVGKKVRIEIEAEAIRR
jgi:polyisoprenoid-binding protein YceI